MQSCDSRKKNWLLAAIRFAMTEIMSPKVAELAIKRGQRYVSDEKGNDAGSCEFFLASTKLSVTSDKSGTKLSVLELR